MNGRIDDNRSERDRTIQTLSIITISASLLQEKQSDLERSAVLYLQNLYFLLPHRGHSECENTRKCLLH